MSLLHLDFPAGSPKSDSHSKRLLQVQTEDSAGALLAVGTEKAQFGPGCQEPMRLSLILPSWILEPTPEADWFHMAGQRVESVCSVSFISSWPVEDILHCPSLSWWGR